MTGSRPTGRVTMQQVADAAGVSLTAVSHILGPRAGAGYAAATIAEVTSASRRLGFRPNAAAKAISSGRFSSVLLLQDANPERTLLSPMFILGLSERLAAAAYRLTVATIADCEVPGGVAKVLEHIHADVVVANYHTDLPSALRRTLRLARLPVLWVNRRDAAVAVLHDDEAMGRQAVDRLLAQGHRRITYLDPWLERVPTHRHHSQHARYHGYAQAVSAAGLQPEAWTVPAGLDARSPGFVRAYRSYLSSPQRPTAVIVAVPPWALLEAAASLGLESSDLQVVSLSDWQSSPDRVLPHVCCDWLAAGLATGDLALACVQSPSMRKHVVVPPLAIGWLPSRDPRARVSPT